MIFMEDLGSIRLIGYGQLGKKDYILFSEDLDKLPLVENANTGSTAFCIDTEKLYIKHDSTWYEVNGVTNRG